MAIKGVGVVDPGDFVMNMTRAGISMESTWIGEKEQVLHLTLSEDSSSDRNRHPSIISFYHTSP